MSRLRFTRKGPNSAFCFPALLLGQTQSEVTETSASGGSEGIFCGTRWSWLPSLFHLWSGSKRLSSPLKPSSHHTFQTPDRREEPDCWPTHRAYLLASRSQLTIQHMGNSCSSTWTPGNSLPTVQYAPMPGVRSILTRTPKRSPARATSRSSTHTTARKSSKVRPFHLCQRYRYATILQQATSIWLHSFTCQSEPVTRRISVTKQRPIP